MINTVILDVDKVKMDHVSPKIGQCLRWKSIFYSGCESRKAILIILFNRVVDKLRSSLS